MFTDRSPLTPSYLRGKAKDNREWAQYYWRSQMPNDAKECEARARDFDREADEQEAKASTESVGQAIAGFVAMALVFVSALGWWVAI